MILHSVSTATSEPLSIEAAKLFLRVDSEDEDSTIEDLILAAREQAELHHNRILAQRQFRLVLDAWPAERSIELLDPLVTVDQVGYRDASGAEVILTAGVNYIADTWARPGRVVLPQSSSWPSAELWPASPIFVVFTAGYAAAMVPKLVKLGMQIAISSWFDNRDQKERTAPDAAIRCWEVDRLERV